MKTLYESITERLDSYNESILSSNKAGAGAELDKRLDEFNNMQAFHIFDADVPYDFFCKWLDEDKFERLCIRCLKNTRKKRGQYDFDDWMNVKLTDGVLIFRFSKNRDFIYFRPMLTNRHAFDYWNARAAVLNAIEPQSWPMSWKPEKQLEAFYHYFEKNKDEVKNHKTNI